VVVFHPPEEAPHPTSPPPQGKSIAKAIQLPAITPNGGGGESIYGPKQAPIQSFSVKVGAI